MKHESDLYEAKKKTTNELEEDRKQRESTLKTFQDNVQAKAKEILNKQQEIENKREEKKKLEGEVKELQQEKLAKKGELEAAHARVLARENTVKLLDQQLALLNDRDTQLSNNVKNVETKLEQKIDEIKSTAAKADRITAAMQNKETEKTNRQAIIGKSSDILKRLDEPVTNNNAKIRALEQAYEQIRGQLNAAGTALEENAELKTKCFGKLRELDKNVTDFKVSHHKQQEGFIKESNRILLKHPDVIRLQQAQAVHSSQHRRTTNN